jgi:hypothetical protein
MKRNLSGKVPGIAGTHALTVGPDGRRGIFCKNRFSHDGLLIFVAA